MIFFSILENALRLFGIFWNEKLKTAQTPEDIEEYTINPSTYNAFRTTIYVTIIAVVKIMLQSILF